MGFMPGITGMRCSKVVSEAAVLGGSDQKALVDKGP